MFNRTTLGSYKWAQNEEYGTPINHQKAKIRWLPSFQNCFVENKTTWSFETAWKWRRYIRHETIKLKEFEFWYFTKCFENIFIISGNLFEIKCDLTIENDSTSPLLSPEIKELEIKICDLLTASKHLNRQQRHAVTICLTEIQASLITLIGASPTGSILVYFLCETSQSILVFEQMLETGRLRKIIERLVNCVLESSSNHLTVTISWDKEYLTECIDRAHKAGTQHRIPFLVSCQPTFSRDYFEC